VSKFLRLYTYHNGDLYLPMIKHLTLFSLLKSMKKSLKAQIRADVKVYLIPKDQLQIVDGKPKLDDKFLVYDSKKKGG